MKKQPYLIVLSTILFCFASSFAQDSTQGLDTIGISKPKKNKYLYEFNDPVLSTITIKERWLKRSPVSSGEVLGSIGRTALTLLAGPGWTFGSSKEVFWNLRSELISNNPNLSWEVNLFCPGVLEKNKQRVTNDDGSYSVETEKVAYLNWHEQSTGIILEHGDTIGRFIIILDPRTNTLLNRWNEIPYREQPSRYKPYTEKVLGMTFSSNENIDFGIVGKLRDNDFVLLYNGDLWQSWLFEAERLKMIFDADIDDLPMVKKKDRLPPLLRGNKPFNTVEKYDLMRLAMLSRYISKTVNQDTFEL